MWAGSLVGDVDVSKAGRLTVCIAGAFAQQAPALTGLSAKVQRALACCLCQAATGLRDDAQRDQYINHLLQNIAGQTLSMRLLCSTAC